MELILDSLKHWYGKNHNGSNNGPNILKIDISLVTSHSQSLSVLLSSLFLNVGSRSIMWMVSDLILLVCCAGTQMDLHSVLPHS